MKYENFKQDVLAEMDPDFHDDNIGWIYNKDQTDVSDEVDTLLRFMLLMETKVSAALAYLSLYRNDFLDRNYDGPDDGEAWSGGFADNH